MANCTTKPEKSKDEGRVNSHDVNALAEMENHASPTAWAIQRISSESANATSHSQVDPTGQTQATAISKARVQRGNTVIRISPLVDQGPGLPSNTAP